MNSGKSKDRVAPVSRRRVWLFRLAALALPVVCLALLELALRLAGAGYPASFFVPHPEQPDLLVDNYKFAWRFFPKSLARTPQPIVVAKEKPKDKPRILVMGGSAAMGDPEPAYGMPRVLEVLLQDRFPDKDFEVINCAMTAINSHVVRSIAADCRRLNADAWVIYMGNNEVHGPFGVGTVFGVRERPLWLARAALNFQRTKIGQSTSRLMSGDREPTPTDWGGMEMFLQQQIHHDDRRLERVYTDFAKNLASTLRSVGSDTKVVVSSVVTNLKDFPPFVSLHRPGLSAEELAAWEAEYQAGQDAQRDGQWEEAARRFQTAAEIDGTHAELLYRLATCFQRRGMTAEAADHFRAARDYDALRFRADSRINQMIASTARDTGADFLDSEREFASSDPSGVVGNEFFYEHVHFNFDGNYRLATLIAERLAEACGWEADPEDPSADRDWLAADEVARLLGVTPFHDRLTLQDVAQRLSKPPFDQQLGQGERDANIRQQIRELSLRLTPAFARDVVQQYQQLVQQRPGDWVLRKQFALMLDSSGDLEGALAQFREIATLLPHHPESFFRLGAQLNRTKDFQQAEAALSRAIELRPDFARAYNSLGICLAHQGRVDEGFAAFQRAVQLRPSFAEAYVNWGMVLLAQNRAAEAVAKYEAAITADEDYVDAHVKLGEYHAAEKNYAAALPCYQAVARLRPHDIAAQLNLGLLYVNLNQPQEAQKQLQTVLKISPGHAQALKTLQAIKAVTNRP